MSAVLVKESVCVSVCTVWLAGNDEATTHTSLTELVVVVVDSAVHCKQRPQQQQQQQQYYFYLAAGGETRYALVASASYITHLQL